VPCNTISFTKNYKIDWTKPSLKHRLNFCCSVFGSFILEVDKSDLGTLAQIEARGWAICSKNSFTDFRHSLKKKNHGKTYSTYYK
jgi:hypothetical protein